jgi:uncharacterized protein YqkB
MQITFTDNALTQIHQMLEANHPAAPSRLKLAYDSEGCGCAVNGVAALWIVDGPDGDDVESTGSPYRVLFDKKHEVFFDDAMTVDYNMSRRAFTLKSKQQIYNSMMRLIDKRHTK